MRQILLTCFLCVSMFSFQSAYSQEFSKIYSSDANTFFRNTHYSSFHNCYFVLGEYGSGSTRVGMVTKMDLYGNVIWSKKFNISSLLANIFEVIDSTNNKSYLIIGGSTLTGGNNVQIIKMDSDNGNVVWGKQYSTVTYPHTLVQNNQVYFIGTINSRGVVIANLNTDGSIKWSKYYSSPNHELYFAGYPDIHSNGTIALTYKAYAQYGVLAIKPDGNIIFSKISNVSRRFRNISATDNGFIFSYVYDWDRRNNNHGFIKIDTTGNLLMNKRIYSTNPNLSTPFGEFSVTQTKSKKIIYNTVSGISGRYANDYFVFDINGNLQGAYDSKLDSLTVELLNNVPNDLVTLCGSSVQKQGCISSTNNALLSIFKETGSLCGLTPFNTLRVENDPMILVDSKLDVTIMNLSVTNLNYTTTDIKLTPSLMCNDGAKLFSLGPDIQQCNNQPMVLNAGLGFKSYLWSTGATSSSIQVITSNNYWVTITDQCNRVFSDTIKVTIQSIPPKNQTIRICQGQSYSIGNNKYTTAGAYTDTLKSSANCDSIIKTTLIVNPRITTQQSFSICIGESVRVGNKVYRTAGTFRDTLNTVNGCDSILTTTISIKPNATRTLTYNICNGDSVKVANKTYKSTGTYRDTIKAQNGCDSIIIINLTVNPTFNRTQNLSICQGDSIKIGTKIYKTSGTFRDTLKTGLNCDSIIVTQLTVRPTFQPQISFNICQGDSVKIGNQVFKTTGNYTVNLKSLFGCDSIVKLYLSVSENILRNQTIKLCEGDSIQVGQKFYFSAGVFKDTLTSFSGCDSILTTNIEILSIHQTALEYKICQGDSVKVGSSIYTTSGEYKDVLKNVFGCDSTITTKIQVLSAHTENIDFKICNGDSVTHNNHTFYMEGIYTDTIISTLGCDSIYTFINISFESELQLDLGNDTTLCFEETIQLGSLMENLDYTWSTGSENQYIDAPAPGTYSLTISNSCYSTSDTIILNAIDCNCSVFIPNAFSPNGDGKNDVLIIKEENVIQSRFIIYNKWGQEVFATDDQLINWNGTFKEKQLPPDVYGYLYEGTCLKGNKIEYKGNITIVR